MSEQKKKRRPRKRRPGTSNSTSDTDVRTLRVGVKESKFPNYINSTHLKQHFSEFEADIEKAMIIRDLETMVSKGYGLVIFTSREAAVRAKTALEGTYLRRKLPIYMRFEKESDLTCKSDDWVHHETDWVPRKTGGWVPHKTDRVSGGNDSWIRETDRVPRKTGGWVPHKTDRVSGANDSWIHETNWVPRKTDDWVPRKTESYTAAQTEDSNCELYFRGMEYQLPNSINKEDIRCHFAEFEQDIVRVTIPQKQGTKQPKGFGFIKFTSHQVAVEAKKKLHGSKFLDKYRLHVDMRKHPGSAAKKASTSILKATQHKPYSRTFPSPLKSEAVKVDPNEFQAMLNSIVSQNGTQIELKQDRRIVISGDKMESVEKSWKEIEEFLNTVTMSVRLSCASVKFLQVKNASYLDQLRSQCDVQIPSTTVSHKTISVKVKGNKANAESVIEKLNKFSSKCCVELFEAQYLKNRAKQWEIHLNCLSNQQPNVLIETDEGITSSRIAMDESSPKRPITVMIVGTDKDAVKDLKAKVLNDDNYLQTTKRRMKLSSQEFEMVLSNKEKLELKLEQFYSTVMELQSDKKVVQLEVPILLESNIESVEQEIVKIIGTHSEDHSQPIGETPFHFDDIVLGMLITGESRYLQEIQREASQKSVIVHIELKPVPLLRLRGGQSQDVEAIQEKICLLSQSAKKEIDQTQTEVSLTSYQLLCTDAFSKCQEELLEKQFVNVTYPPQENLLRQQLLCTSLGYTITLQLCVGDVTTENVDAIIIDFKLAETLSDPLFQEKFKGYIQKNGVPMIGSVTCFKSGKLPCRSVIVVPVPNWKRSNDTWTRESIELRFAPYKEPLVCSDSKGFGTVSFILSENSSVPVDMSTCILISMIEQFCKSHPKTPIHTIRIAVSQQSSAECTMMYDKHVPAMKVAKKTPAPLKQIPHKKSSPLLPPMPSLQWQWYDDNGFKDYPPNISAKLTKTKRCNPTGKCSFSINGKNYEVNMSTMEQRNTVTNFNRKVRQVSSDSQSSITQRGLRIQWYYLDDQNILTPYTANDSNTIETIHNGSLSETTQITIQGRQYKFDFTMMKQINATTNTKRSIQRKQIPAPTSLRKEVKESPPLKAEKEPLVITLRGPKQNLARAKEMVEMKLKELCHKETISLPQTASNQLQQKLHTIVRKHKVEYRIKDATVKGSTSSRPGKIFEIEGPENAVGKAVMDIQREIIKFQSEAPSTASAVIEYPREWKTQSKTTQVFELSPYFDERHKIISKLKETLPDSTVISVKRIQNKWLWEKYEQCRRRMHEKNSGIVNEKQLFHGSRNTSADKIYDSEEGFDMRFSSKGMWGLANYFAVDASYSDSYAYLKTDGTKELLLAKVLTGCSYTSGSNSELRMPPEKPTSSNTKIQLGQQRYDTVNGNTNGTEVYMTYSNDKAYPAYLIVYSTRTSMYRAATATATPRPTSHASAGLNPTRSSYVPATQNTSRPPQPSTGASNTSHYSTPTSPTSWSSQPTSSPSSGGYTSSSSQQQSTRKSSSQCCIS